MIQARQQPRQYQYDARRDQGYKAPPLPPPRPPPRPQRDYDIERDDSYESFEDPSVRRAFIRKVYTILFVMLSVTFGIVCIFVFNEAAQRIVFRYPFLMFVFMGVYFVLVIAISCYEHCRRTVPLNFVLLFILTFAMAMLAGFFAALHRPDIVLMAIGLTAGICLLLTLFAMQTSIDFTVCGAGLFIACILLMVFGIVAMFFPGKIITLIYCSCGAFLMSIYFIYDTQLMLGGDHAYSLSPEEYIMGALNLYVDIVTLFIYIMGIISAAEN